MEDGGEWEGMFGSKMKREAAMLPIVTSTATISTIWFVDVLGERR